MVWYGMVWYGMVWYGMVWYGMVWYGMVWYGMVWYGTVVRYGGTVRYILFLYYFMVGECVRFLFTSCDTCERSLNKRVSAANE